MKEVCNTLSILESTILEGDAPKSTKAAVNHFYILKLQKSLKPSPGIYHWPASCSFVCVSAPSERFAGARRTSGQEPRPPILTASLRRAAM